MNKKKIAICWIGIGRYNELFEDFYCSFNEKFCLECERTFFIFTDTPSITDGLDNCLTYTISHACKHVGFILFRKFKYLLMAEDKFLDYDYVIFCNGNLECLREIAFSEIDPGDKNISSVEHPYDCPSMRHLNLDFCTGSYAQVKFKDWNYLQAAFFVAKSGFFLKMANAVESMRMQDKVEDKSALIPWHDESYYNAFLYKYRKDIHYLKYLMFNFPENIRKCDTFNDHDKVDSLQYPIAIRTRKKPAGCKGVYSTFKNDLY